MFLFYVKESKGKYYLADPKWSRAYEEGLIFDKEPAACFSSESDAQLFLAIKMGTIAPINNAERYGLSEPPAPHKKDLPQCPVDCKYRFGHMNEEKCDYCVRKGNIHDFYEPEEGGDNIGGLTQRYP